MKQECTRCGAIRDIERFQPYTTARGEQRRRSICKDCHNRRTRDILALQPPKPPPPDRKICRVCGVEQPIDRFGAAKSCKDGHRNTCWNCILDRMTPEQRERNRLRSNQWGADHAEIARERAREWRLNNIDQAQATSLRYRLANRAALAQAKRLWRMLNPDKARARNRAYYETNKAKIAIVAKAYRMANPDKGALYQLNRRARRKAGAGTVTVRDIKRIYFLQKGKCAYCPTKLSKNFHRDHIMPLMLRGMHDKRNIQLTCGPCNLRKGRKHPIDFARELGRLL